ncbi:hypothetical protein EV586_10480 [Tumebacillus sp. BK434]|uniref:hypothetical protein n=1 Tax=Tumebacillus sp. BK434 TaxID=2512169 RepID=UPI00104FFD1A|nr:hypothetical protein [Tumebacillus sp. BK434]TCP54462.1 hypothetical protein EV586_10480 [Tumebacillus sp. BK434]
MNFSRFVGRDVDLETFGGRRIRGRVVIIRDGVIIIRVRSRRRRRRRRSFVFVRTVQVSRGVVVVR